MAIVDHLTYGWVNPALAYVMSFVGCLLGILLASKARKRTGRHRIRLLVYASFAFGGIGIWLAQALALLGLSLPQAVVRFDPVTLAVSLAVALVDVGTGLFLAIRGQLTARTLIPAGVVIGLGVTATSFTNLQALRVTATVTYNPLRFAASVALCVLLAPLALWSAAAVRGLVSTVVCAGVLGVIVCGIHYGAQWSMVVYFRQSISDIGGVSAPALLPPLILAGATVAAMLAYFTFGSATLHELRAIYGPREQTDPIEPWMIAMVTARVIGGTNVSPLPLYLDRARLSRADAHRRRPRPTPAGRAGWPGAPVREQTTRTARNDGHRGPVEVRPAIGVVRFEADTIHATATVAATTGYEAGTALPRRVVTEVAEPAVVSFDDIDEAVISLAVHRSTNPEPQTAQPPLRRWRNRRR